MGASSFSKWWRDVVAAANSKGVPIPLVRYRGEGNPALTVFLISSVLVIVGIVGKWAGHLGGIDMNNAMSFFYASSTLFFGHTAIHRNSDGSSDTVETEKNRDVGPV
jgi:hypothetical protein